jgi:hypothetical protein
MRRKPVHGTLGLYEITDTGVVFSLHRGRDRERRLSAGGAQYLMVALYVNGRSTVRTVHSLVAEAFLGPKPSSKHVVNHRDGNKLNNHWRNLEWATRKEDRQHAIRMGLWDPRGHEPVRGSSHWNARLTEQQVREIRRLVAARKPRKMVAARFRITAGAVHDIARGKSWAHLKFRPNEQAPDYVGDMLPHAKLNEQKVRSIRNRRATGESFRSIAKSLGVCAATIISVVNRQSWAHIE